MRWPGAWDVILKRWLLFVYSHVRRQLSGN
jgi:hypothetical protein